MSKRRRVGFEQVKVSNMRMVALGTLLLLTPSSLLHAQDQASDAPQLFLEGTALLGEERFAEARAVLERAFALEPRASTGFNLASALHGEGRSVEAATLLDRVEAGEFGALPEGYQEVVADLRSAIGETIATLVLDLRRPTEAQLLLDGEAIGSIAVGSRVERLLSPGVHRLEAVAPGYRPWTRQLPLRTGQRLRVPIELLPLSSEPLPIEEVEEGGFPVWVLVVAGAALLVGGGIAVGVLVAGSSDDGALRCDPVLGCIDT
ncbi:MAG: hypothetical protein AAGF12_28380 [Myxococcota bacterium]